MINLIHVRSFLAVVDTKGIRAAARVLELAPSTVVDHVKQLEADLSAPLVVRDYGAATPTPQGARFLPFARALMSTASRARDLMHHPLLRLAAASNIGIYMLQPPLAAFQRETGIKVELWIGSNPLVAERLARGEADLAAMEWWDDRSGFAANTWAREPLVVIVAPGHRWADRGKVSVGEISSEPMLGGEPGSGTGRLLREQLGSIAEQLRTVSGFGSTEAVKRAVRAGRGISIVMKSAVTDEVASRQIIALSIEGVELIKEIKFVVPDQLPPTAPAMTFLADCRG